MVNNSKCKTVVFKFFIFIDPYYWGPEFNYEFCHEKRNVKPAVRYISDVVRYWIKEFHLNGLRFDAGK
jgi:1,4-alpha-glucan branching enzyme